MVYVIDLSKNMVDLLNSNGHIDEGRCTKKINVDANAMF